MGRLTLTEVEALRRTPGRSVLLFLTDRCPVGCAHCSVNSQPDSPTITDFSRFHEIVEAIAARPSIRLVGISGGEPFVERRGLTLAVSRLAEAGKALALYTSGVWASAHPPDWVRPLIRRASCVFLSTDAFHQDSVDADRFVRAAQLIAAESVWLIVQVLNLPEMVEKARSLLTAAFGEQHEAFAELSLVEPLPYGRAASIFAPHQSRPGHTFGGCNSLAAPVIRYDGVAVACCNERVIMGAGPDRLRSRCSNKAETLQALARFAEDPLLNMIGGAGAGALVQHPRFAALAEREFTSICDLCWAAQALTDPSADRSDRLLHAINNLMAKKGEPSV